MRPIGTVEWIEYITGAVHSGPADIRVAAKYVIKYFEYDAPGVIRGRMRFWKKSPALLESLKEYLDLLAQDWKSGADYRDTSQLHQEDLDPKWVNLGEGRWMHK